MNPSIMLEPRPEAMGDVPGVCELPLTRAVVQYRDVQEMDTQGGRIEDIGLAVVVDGQYASAAECLDLGSGNLKVLDLSTELVVLDWVYEPTLEHLSTLLTQRATRGSEDGGLGAYASGLGLRILERVGFGPLSRPTFLRIGFRDICRDFDLHEGTSIRFVLGPGRLARAHLDYDGCALLFRTAFNEPDARLEHALLDSFPDAEVRRLVPGTAMDGLGYRVRQPLPVTLAEARTALGSMRRGLAALMARFEPDRFRALESVMDTFGARETLARLDAPGTGLRAVRVTGMGAGTPTVH